MKNIAIFASGTGTNARAILAYFAAHKNIKISLIVCNKPGAKVLEVADEFEVPTIIIPQKQKFAEQDFIFTLVSKYQITHIVLAGFLWLVPEKLIEVFPKKIINIHPALLPKYGGKGMYGSNVHKAVIAAHEKESGITIHYVNAQYDKGDIIFQAKTTVDKAETPETLAKKIHLLEHYHYPQIIEKLWGYYV